MKNANLPTHIQRSWYAPGPAQRRADKDAPFFMLEQFKKAESMVLRGPGKIGDSDCNAVARFAMCPDDLLESLIYRYNQHNYLLKKIERKDKTIAALQAHLLKKAWPTRLANAFRKMVRGVKDFNKGLIK